MADPTDDQDNPEDQEDGQIMSVDEQPSDVEETDDGGAIVKMGKEETPEGEKEFYRNLAHDLDKGVLDELARQLIERIDFDKRSRKPRDDKYAEGIKRTGLGDEAPGGAAFEGASTVTHPMLSKATVYYQSHTIGELMPPNGPVKDWIPGENTQARVDKSKRKSAHMNWQFKKQMPEFRSELEKLLSQQPLGGSQYMRLIYDSRKKRPVPTFYPIDKVIIPEAAADFYSAERRTIIDSITQAEFEGRVRDGYYVDTTVGAPAMAPERTASQEASQRAEGVDPPAMNEDGLRTIYVIEAMASIEDPENPPELAGETKHGDSDSKTEPNSAPMPYLIELDLHLKKILLLIRNWEEDDPQQENMCWMADFPFIPWRGAQSVGMIHLMGSLAGAGTGSLRSLLDTALVQNIPTLLKLAGNEPGESLRLEPCTINEIKGGRLDADIRSMVMAVPFNPPSTMLYQLLGWCTEQGEEIIRTTFENLSEDGSANMPVGTTLALIEQGLKVLAAIHLRLHHAMDRVIAILHRINRLYITDDEIRDDTGELLARHSDYEGPLDVVPVSDPEIFSDIQRFAQLQIVQQRADLHPELYDARKVEELILERTKIPNAKQLLKPIPQVQELNQVNENIAMVLGRPVAAFPDQEHLAHIQVLLDFMQSPLLGSNPIMAPSFIGPALQHLKEHLVYLYLTLMDELVTHTSGGEPGKMMLLKDKGVNQELDKTLAAASSQVMQQMQQIGAKILPVIQKAQQTMSQLSPPPQADPTATAVANIEQQGKQKIQDSKNQADAASQAADSKAKIQQTQMEQQGDDQRTQADIQSHEKINADDNATALEIAAAKIETGHSTNLSTGTGIEGHEGPTEGGGNSDGGQ